MSMILINSVTQLWFREMTSFMFTLFISWINFLTQAALKSIFFICQHSLQAGVLVEVVMRFFHLPCFRIHHFEINFPVCIKFHCCISISHVLGSEILFPFYNDRFFINFCRGWTGRVIIMKCRRIRYCGRWWRGYWTGKSESLYKYEYL